MTNVYLERLLGSRTRVNALAVLVTNPRKAMLEVELASEAGASVSEVNRQMKDLVTAGIVLLERVGKGKVYRINKRHFLFKPFRNLFRDLESVYTEVASRIVSEVTRKFKIRAAILFGSLSRGSIRSDIVEEPSDIDILIVASSRDVNSIKHALLSFINSEISEKYGIMVYPMVLSLDEYLSGLESDPFIIDVHSKGAVLYGEKPRRFG